MPRSAMPTRPPSDELLTMAPPPCSRICSSSYFMQFPDTTQIYAHDEVVVGWVGVSGLRDGALHASIVERGVQAPKGRKPVSLTIAATSPRSETSQRMPIALWPAATKASAAMRAPGSVEVCQGDGPLPLARRPWLSPRPMPEGGARNERNLVLK